jgi:dUTP pyrophosphatase
MAISTLMIKRLRENAIKPEYKTDLAAGFDLSACFNPEKESETREVVAIPPMSQYTMGTGLAVAIPRGHEMQIRPRSGLAHSKEISITNSPGTIDADFRGEVGVIVRNNSKTETFHIKDGDRIAQGVIAPVPRFPILEVDDLDVTDRGEGGWGSTGVSK